MTTGPVQPGADRTRRHPQGSRDLDRLQPCGQHEQHIPMPAGQPGDGPCDRPYHCLRINTVHGVLKLTLHPSSYEWAFIGTDRVVYDSGTGSCH